MAISTFFTRLGQQIKFAFLQHPLEIILISVAAIPTLFWDFRIFGNLSYWLFTPIYFALIYLSNGHKWLYKLSATLPFIGTILIYSFDEKEDYYLDEPKFWAANVLLFLILIAAPFYRENRQFIYRTFIQLFNFLLACLTGWLIWGMLSILIFSIENLFDMKFYYQTYDRIAIFSNLFFIPLFFLTFQQKQKDIELTSAPFMQIIIQFVLSPVLMIYTFLLYAYTLQIVFLGEFPKGMVANLVMPYLAVGLGIYCLQILCEKSRWIGFFRAFPYLSLLPLALLWFALYQRIEAYSWTEARIYLVAISTALSVCYALLMLPAVRQYRYFLGVVMVSIFTMTFVIQPEEIAFKSQSARFEQQLNLLGLLDNQGKIRDDFNLKTDFKNLSEEQIEQYRTLVKQLDYLRDKTDFENKQLIETYSERINVLLNLHVYDNGQIMIDDTIAIEVPTSLIGFNLNRTELDIQGYRRLIHWRGGQFIDDNPDYEEIKKGEQIEFLFDYKGEEIVKVNINEMLKNLFEKNGLDITKQYTSEQLNVLSDQILEMEIPEKGVKIIFGYFRIRFIENIGYIFDYANDIILLTK